MYFELDIKSRGIGITLTVEAKTAQEATERVKNGHLVIDFEDAPGIIGGSLYLYPDEFELEDWEAWNDQA